MAERESNKRGIEQLVTQLKAKFDSSQLSLDRAHQLGSSVGDLSALSSVPLKHQSTGDLSGGFNLDRERIKYLEKRVKFLENEVKQKENEFMNSDPQEENVRKISRLEAKILDLEENLKEKDALIDAKSQAASLISESLSLKGKDVLDLLEETKSEMAKMQESFTVAGEEYKMQLKKLEKELQAKDKRIANLEEVNDILETARFDLTLKNAQMDSKTGNVEDYIIKLNELNKVNETLQHRIEELEAEKDDGSSESGKTRKTSSAGSDNDDVQTSVAQALQIQKLEEQIDQLKTENSELTEALKVKSNAPETSDIDIQTKLESFEEEIKAKTRDCDELKEKLANLDDKLQEKTVEYNVLLANFNALEETLQSYAPKSMFSSGSADEEAQMEITKLTKQLDDANKVNIKTKLKMKQLQKQIDTMKKSSDLNRELVKQSDENQRLVDKIASLEKEIAKLQDSSNSIVNVNIDSKDGKASELEAKVKLLETTCQNQTSAIQLLEEQKLDMTADLNSTRTELSSLKGHIKDIDKIEVTSQIDSIVMEEQIEANAREVDELRQQIEDLRSEKSQLKEKLERFMAENMELLDKIEKLSKGSSAESIEILERLTHEEKLEMERFQRQRSQPSSITEENEHVKQLEVDGADDKARIELLSTENEQLVKRVDELHSEKETIAKQLEQLKIDNETNLNQLRQLEVDREQMVTNIVELKDIRSTLESEIDVLEREKSCAKESEEENLYKKGLNSLKVELENYRSAKDKNSKVNVSKKLAREAKNLADLVEKLIEDYNASVEKYQLLKNELDGQSKTSSTHSEAEAQEMYDELNRYRQLEKDYQQRCTEFERQIAEQMAEKDELKR